ncbi:MAG: hypothetical protein IPN17_31115 [Deltaproteobacteria bacterium]|nr:hypothetical protein [Deltaproteobacteria bacterium]
MIAVKRLLSEGWSSESIVSHGLLFEHDLEDLEGRLDLVISGMERGFGAGRDASTLELVRRELREARSRRGTARRPGRRRWRGRSERFGRATRCDRAGRGGGLKSFVTSVT